MAQKTEKEETEFKVPETITPCVNNCGVTGNPATNNMCQQCFNASTTSTTSSSSVSSSTFSIGGISSTSNFSDEKASRSSTSRSPKRSYPSSDESTLNPSPDRSNREDPTPSEAKRVVNRCSGCRRKVGLTGFRCRCGDLFCAEHRYSDRHDCSYDYKTVGREAIARENPVIKAAKIVKV